MDVTIYADILGTMNKVARIRWDGQSLYYSSKDHLPLTVMNWLKWMLKQHGITAGSLDFEEVTYYFDTLGNLKNCKLESPKSLTALASRPKKKKPDSVVDLVVAPRVAKVEPTADPMQKHLEDCRKARNSGEQRYNPDLDEVFK